jgi:hypothetical protein
MCPVAQRCYTYVEPINVDKHGEFKIQLRSFIFHGNHNQTQICHKYDYIYTSEDMEEAINKHISNISDNYKHYKQIIHIQISYSKYLSVNLS